MYEFEIADYSCLIIGKDDHSIIAQEWFYVCIMDKFSLTLAQQIEHQREYGIVQESISKIVIQLTFGVHSIHKSGLLHCDLKPENVLI